MFQFEIQHQFSPALLGIHCYIFILRGVNKVGLETVIEKRINKCDVETTLNNKLTVIDVGKFVYDARYM